jgi:hypothetical protein
VPDTDGVQGHSNIVQRRAAASSAKLDIIYDSIILSGDVRLRLGGQMNRRRWLIISLIGISMISALLEGLFYWHGMPSAPASSTGASVLSVILIALWIDADSKVRPDVARCFDYGFLVTMFWLPYLPYYLWRTRGTVGLLTFAGFLGLLSMGFLVQLLIYSLFYL